MKQKVEHLIWIDNIKVFACFLVVLGHFFQSMVKSNILLDSTAYEWFNNTIYYFHVQLFFICSGFLYQKYSKIDTFKKWERNIFKKFISLGIPYFTFTTCSYLIKCLFESNVNTQNTTNLFETLFIFPTAPYWYLYVLFFIFLLTPTLKSHKQINILLSIALLSKLIISFSLLPDRTPYFITKVLDNEIWFALGMSMSVYQWEVKIQKTLAIILAGIFLLLSYCVFAINKTGGSISFILGFLACTSVIGLFYHYYHNKSQSHFMHAVSKYTMPIYLMHTMAAAAARSILIKVGIHSASIHIIIGLSISIAAPILFTFIIEKINYLDIFLYPTKYIKFKTDEKTA